MGQGSKPMKISRDRYPGIYRALSILAGEPRKTFMLIEHFRQWLPNAEKGLGAIRQSDADAWRTFVEGGDLSEILAVRDRRKDLFGAHRILDFFADSQVEDR